MENFKWKGNKKCAVSITVNLKGEYFWLSMFPESKNKPKTLSLGTFGIDVGLDRILSLLESYHVKSTFFVPGAIAEKYEEKILSIHDKGHEIANHGYEHENLALLDKNEQEYAIVKSNDILKSITGSTPIGFRAPEGEITKETYDVLESIGFMYDSSLMDDDMPYYISFGDKTYGIIQLPIKWQLYDFPYFAFNYNPAFPTGQGRIAPYSSVLSNWVYEYEGYKKNGLAYVLQIEPQTIATPGRLQILKKFLDYLFKEDDTWVCTCAEMQDYYKENYKKGLS